MTAIHLRRFFVSTAMAVFLAVAASAERLPIRVYTSADGLGSGFVDRLLRDSKGFLWICSRDGLSRFDGSQFVTYQIGEKGAVSGVETLSETKNGTYWVGTTSGFFRFTAETLSQAVSPLNGRTVLNAEFIGNQRGHMFEGQSGEIWFVSSGISTVREVDGKVSFEKIDLHLPEHLSKGLNLSDHVEDREGAFWFNTPRGIVRRLPDGRVFFFQTDTENNQSTFALGHDGRIWVARGREIFVINPQPVHQLAGAPDFTLDTIKPASTLNVGSGSTLPLPTVDGEWVRFISHEFLGKHAAKRLFVTSDGHVWLTTEENLIEYDGNLVRVHTAKEGFVPGMARMEEDAAGNLWFGGYAGLVRLDRKGLKTYGTDDGLASARIYTIKEDPAGGLYVGTGEMSLGQFDGTRFHAVYPKILPDSTSLWSGRFAFLDRQGEWWLATDRGLHHYDKVASFSDLDGKAPAAIYNKSSGLRNDEAFQIFEDKEGNIWFSQLGSRDDRALVRWTRATKELHTFTEEEGYPKASAASGFIEDRSGAIWMGLYEGGVLRYSAGRFTMFGAESGVSKNVITDMHIDRSGSIWFSSATGGLMRIDDPTIDQPVFTAFTTDDGLASNNIRTITEDKFGRLYLGTVRGVDRFSPDTKRVKHYTVSDGLAADFVVDAHCDANGVLWFATTNGLSRLEPTLDTEQEAPKVFLGRLVIAGEEQQIPQLGGQNIDRGELAHTQNNLQIDFFGLELRAGERLQYQYKFDRTDTDWSTPTDQRSVKFANLAPGDYRFLVRAVNSDGAISVAPAAITFNILPPIWLRWWFLVLAILLVGFVIVMVYRYRLANLRTVNAALSEANRAAQSLQRSREERLAELETVRARIATDLHDDIGASLTLIAVLSEVAQQSSKGNGNGASGGPLSKISSVSNELVGTMSDIVWSINPSKDHLSDMTQRMRRFASDVLSAKGIVVAFEAPDDNDDLKINTNVKREVFLIFKESINNIAKHSGAKQVHVRLEIVGDDLSLEISDDGKGFEPETSIHDTLSSAGHGGNGVLSMKKRAREMNAAIEFTSTPGRGTTIRLLLPLDQAADLPKVQASDRL